MIPGLENAEFARLGGIHRNTFINSPTLLDSELKLKTNIMRNWLLVLIGLFITFIGVITKKFFFLFFIIPLSLFWKKD